MNTIKEKIIIAASLMDETDTNKLWELILDNFPNRSWDNIEETVFHESDSNTLYTLRILQTICQDKEKRLEYEAREKAIRDHNQFLFEAEQRGEQRGRKIGKQEETINIAQNLISLDVPDDIIIKSTKLSVEQIKILRSKQI